MERNWFCLVLVLDDIDIIHYEQFLSTFTYVASQKLPQPPEVFQPSNYTSPDQQCIEDIGQVMTEFPPQLLDAKISS